MYTKAPLRRKGSVYQVIKPSEITKIAQTDSNDPIQQSTKIEGMDADNTSSIDSDTNVNNIMPVSSIECSDQEHPYIALIDHDATQEGELSYKKGECHFGQDHFEKG